MQIIYLVWRKLRYFRKNLRKVKNPVVKRYFWLRNLLLTQNFNNTFNPTTKGGPTINKKL